MSVISLTDYRPAPRFDAKPWTAARVEGTTDLSVWHEIETFDFSVIDADPSQPAPRSFTTELGDPSYTHGRIVFIDGDGDQDATDPFSLIEAPPALATVRDVRVRLARLLTDDEQAQVESLLFAATINILAALDQGLEWTPPAAVRPLLSMLCVEIVCRSMANPQALGQQSESLGAYSHTTTYARELPGSGLMLTDAEELLIRRAVYGQNAGSARGRSDTLYLGLVDQILRREPIVWVQ